MTACITAVTAYLCVQGLLAVLSLPLLPHVLDDGLVELADVVVLGLGNSSLITASMTAVTAYLGVEGQLELPLGHDALDPLAVGGVGGRPVARK